MFSEEQLEQLRSFPEITSDELIRYFTPTAADLAFVSPGGRGPVDRLGMLVQLCALPWLGFVPDDVPSAPPAAVARLSERLGVGPKALKLYGKREQTRSDHLGQVAKYLEWKTAPAGSQAMKELEQFLLDRTMEHDSPTLLFNLAREYLMAAKVIRPGALILAKVVATAGLVHCDEAVLPPLARTHRTLHAGGGQLVLSGAHGVLAWRLRMTRLDTVLELFADVQAPRRPWRG
jgi:hypothetical protein